MLSVKVVHFIRSRNASKESWRKHSVLRSSRIGVWLIDFCTINDLHGVGCTRREKATNNYVQHYCHSHSNLRIFDEVCEIFIFKKMQYLRVNDTNFLDSAFLTGCDWERIEIFSRILCGMNVCIRYQFQKKYRSYLIVRLKKGYYENGLQTYGLEWELKDMTHLPAT